MLKRAENGDTIIEVIIASAVLAMVVVSSFAIMQRGASSAYDSLERSQVRLELNRQSELLQYVRDGFIQNRQNAGTYAFEADTWRTITDDTEFPAAAAPPDLATCIDPNNPPAGAFYFTSLDDAGIDSDFTETDGLASPGQGMWIQRVNVSNPMVTIKYYDFYVMACWQSTTSNLQLMSTIVRLYAPQ